MHTLSAGDHKTCYSDLLYSECMLDIAQTSMAGKKSGTPRKSSRISIFLSIIYPLCGELHATYTVCLLLDSGCLKPAESQSNKRYNTGQIRVTCSLQIHPAGVAVKESAAYLKPAGHIQIRICTWLQYKIGIGSSVQLRRPPFLISGENRVRVSCAIAWPVNVNPAMISSARYLSWKSPEFKRDRSVDA